jgi:hypothetical protein
VGLQLTSEIVLAWGNAADVVATITDIGLGAMPQVCSKLIMVRGLQVVVRTRFEVAQDHHYWTAHMLPVCHRVRWEQWQRRQRST